MSTVEKMNRLERLEVAVREHDLHVSLERDLDAMQPRMEEIAAELDCTVDAFREEVISGIRRRAEIGEYAYEVELAAELGGTVDELRSGELERRCDREWADFVQLDRARRAGVITS